MDLKQLQEDASIIKFMYINAPKRIRNMKHT